MNRGWGFQTGAHREVVGANVLDAQLHPTTPHNGSTERVVQRPRTKRNAGEVRPPIRHIDWRGGWKARRWSNERPVVTESLYPSYAP